jgi:hypothetical protein
MRRLFAVLLLLAFSRPLIAQTTVSSALLEPGARAHRAVRRGTAHRSGRREHRGHAARALARVLERRLISQIEVSTGGQRKLLKGATVGLLAGGTRRQGAPLAVSLEY